MLKQRLISCDIAIIVWLVLLLLFHRVRRSVLLFIIQYYESALTFHVWYYV